MRRGIATFTLDHGKCPKWLFERMVKLGREMMAVLIAEYGSNEFIRRISDPVWFQTLGTVLAFDWNASGLTTILTAALKESIRGRERDFGVFICGGKGKTSMKTPEEITNWSARLSLPDAHARSLIYNSKMSAKVDSSLIQDGFQLYHHSFLFSLDGSWAVVQQGMNTKNATARRYHWSSDKITDLIEEPHAGIATQTKVKQTLDMTSKASSGNREMSLQLVDSGFGTLMKDLQLIRRHSSHLSQMASFKKNEDQLTLLNLEDTEFHVHPVITEDFNKSKCLDKMLWTICDRKPESYEDLLAMKGVGPKTIRALSLISEVIHGAEASYKDPARYSFAHGGKDGTPYFVDRKTYDQSISMLREAISKTSLSPYEKSRAVQRLQFSS